jgi:hypothetical protein
MVRPKSSRSGVSFSFSLCIELVVSESRLWIVPGHLRRRPRIAERIESRHAPLCSTCETFEAFSTHVWRNVLQGGDVGVCAEHGDGLVLRRESSD